MITLQWTCNPKFDSNAKSKIIRRRQIEDGLVAWYLMLNIECQRQQSRNSTPTRHTEWSLQVNCNRTSTVDRMMKGSTYPAPCTPMINSSPSVDQSSRETQSWYGVRADMLRLALTCTVLLYISYSTDLKTSRLGIYHSGWSRRLCSVTRPDLTSIRRVSAKVSCSSLPSQPQRQSTMHCP